MSDATSAPRPLAVPLALDLDATIEVARVPDRTSIAWHLARAAAEAHDLGLEVLARQLRQLARANGLEATW